MIAAHVVHMYAIGSHARLVLWCTHCMMAIYSRSEGTWGMPLQGRGMLYDARYHIICNAISLHRSAL